MAAVKSVAKYREMSHIISMNRFSFFFMLTFLVTINITIIQVSSSTSAGSIQNLNIPYQSLMKISHMSIMVKVLRDTNRQLNTCSEILWDSVIP